LVFGNQKLKKMNQIISIDSKEDIFPEYRNTPIEWLFEYHNLGRQFDTFEKAQLLVGMCMDNRKHLHMPDNFAYIIRSGGANLRHSEFKVSYAIAVGQISHIVLLAHNHCGMVNLFSRKNEFIKGWLTMPDGTRSRLRNILSTLPPCSKSAMNWNLY